MKTLLSGIVLTLIISFSTSLFSSEDENTLPEWDNATSESETIDFEQYANAVDPVGTVFRLVQIAEQLRDLKCEEGSLSEYLLAFIKDKAEGPSLSDWIGLAGGSALIYFGDTTALDVLGVLVVASSVNAIFSDDKGILSISKVNKKNDKILYQLLIKNLPRKEMKNLAREIQDEIDIITDSAIEHCR